MHHGTLGDLSDAIDISSRLRVRSAAANKDLRRLDQAVSTIEAFVMVLWFLLPSLAVLFLLHSAWPSSVARFMHGAALYTGIGFAFALTLTLVLTLRAHTPVSVSVRSLALIFLRPPILLFCWLVAIAQFPASFAVGEVDSFGTGWARAMGYLLGALSLLLFIKWLFDPATRAVAVVILSALATYALISIAIGRFVKVLLDVARYIADPRYRMALHVRLDAQLELIPRDKRIVIASHSLGTVIALDSLMHSDAWRGRREVVLITAGSPLRRLIGRFLPEMFFPTDLSFAAEVIAGRLVSFRWINCYRPWDPVGGSLGLRATAGRHEILIQQWWRILNGHTDYWSDREAIEAVISRMAGDSAFCASEGSASWHPPEIELAERFARRPVQRALRWLALTIVLAMALGVGSLFLLNPIGSFLESVFAALFAALSVGFGVGLPFRLYLRWLGLVEKREEPAAATERV